MTRYGTQARIILLVIYKPSYCNFPESRKKNKIYLPTLNIRVGSHVVFAWIHCTDV